MLLHMNEVEHRGPELLRFIISLSFVIYIMQCFNLSADVSIPLSSLHSCDMTVNLGIPYILCSGYIFLHSAIINIISGFNVQMHKTGYTDLKKGC